MFIPMWAIVLLVLLFVTPETAIVLGIAYCAFKCPEISIPIIFIVIIVVLLGNGAAYWDEVIRPSIKEHTKKLMQQKYIKKFRKTAFGKFFIKNPFWCIFIIFLGALFCFYVAIFILGMIAQLTRA